ncbi:MAG TPA: ATP synthase F1 subunit gamma [Candidatus Acidoferrales bacterium]|nr:ATP synthase F1 subunit gamma [Candidatus Acidoferrales bacterium]
MPTLIDFRRRIRSVKNTQQITRAMKFVAAAKLRRAQERALAVRPYAREMRRVLRSAMARIESPNFPLMAHRPEERILVLVLTGNKGLCGAFNTNVVRRALEFFREHAQQRVRVIPVGKKGRDALRKRRLDLAAEYVNLSASVEFSQAREIASRVIEMFSSGEVDAVYAVFNEFKSVLTQRLLVEKLLPIEAEQPSDDERSKADDDRLERLAEERSVLHVDYIYEEPPEEIYAKLLPRYVETQVFQVLLESAASEQAARMTAMDSATNNAAELIEQLTLYMNKVRQAAITREIIEVVSGAVSTD